MRRSFKVLLGVVAVLALGTLWSLCWADDTYKDGDGVFRTFYRYQQGTELPGTHEDTDHHNLGIGYGFFMAEDVSLELSGWMPVGDGGMDNLSFGAGLNYYFDHVYIPLSVSYRNDLDTLAFGGGVGLDFPVGNRMVLQAEAGPQYLGDNDISDRWTWSATGSLGWQFSGPDKKKCHRGHHKH